MVQAIFKRKHIVSKNIT